MDSEANLPIKKPVSVWKRPVQLKIGKLTQSLAKGSISVLFQNWQATAKSGVDLLDAMGLQNDPAAVAWLLVKRSLLRAMLELVRETRLSRKNDLDLQQLSEQIDLAFESAGDLSLPVDFFDRPKSLPFLDGVREPYRRWLEVQGLEGARSQNLSDRLSIYFVHSLHDEWRSNPAHYAILTAQRDTPFAKASEREWAWKRYLIWLQFQVNRPMFEESFGLKDVYIPLRGYYNQKQDSEAVETEDLRFKPEKLERVVIDLHLHLMEWVENAEKDDAIRVICGGPGSGKSSFGKMFAAQLAEDETKRVLFIPLHRFKLLDELQAGLQSFIDNDLEGILPPNPLKKENAEEKILLIFDGLDELAMQGKTAVQVAQDFIIEVKNKLIGYNREKARVLVLMSGRDLAVQSSQGNFKRSGQILHVLPYIQSKSEKKEHAYIDEKNLLETDLRRDWWQKYSELKGKVYKSLPKELEQEKLFEITAQPLLNYLVALIYDDETSFSAESNLNTIYRQLLTRVYQRDWENYQHPTLGSIEEKDFIRILAEIAVTCWHGNGRTATLEQMEKRCQSSPKLKKVLQVMCCNSQSGDSQLQSGVTQLLTAFYFRQSEQFGSDATFEFTHKSFGEYLTARRIVLQLSRTHEEFQRNQEDSDIGWSEKICLEHWARLCGSSEVDCYLLSFLRDEIALQPPEKVQQWQQTLCKLIGFMLRKGMPMENLDSCPSYFEQSWQARNAEEALLAALSSCAYVTEIISDIEWPDSVAFGNWLARLRGQRSDWDNKIVLMCLNHLNLSGLILIVSDLYRANLTGAKLIGAVLSETNLINSVLTGADLTDANLTETMLTEALLTGADLEGADLTHAELTGADISDGNLIDAKLTKANFTDAILSRTNLAGANLAYTTLTRANLAGANLAGANLTGTRLVYTEFTGANLSDANLSGASLIYADLSGASLIYTNLSGADFSDAGLLGADFSGANLENAILPEGFEIQKSPQNEEAGES
ncbi:MAG: pentapeptide repeat-containing protein [Cyanobacteria bacterium P01_E01_bin.42]